MTAALERADDDDDRLSRFNFILDEVSGHSDWVLGLAWMMEAIVILGVVRNATRDTPNRVADITCSAISTEKENPIGWTGLKTHATNTKIAAHAYLRKFTACTSTNTAAAVLWLTLRTLAPGARSWHGLLPMSSCWLWNSITIRSSHRQAAGHGT